MKWYFQDDILIRKEHFGTLVLLLNGSRFVMPNQYFDLLKNIQRYNSLPISKCLIHNGRNSLNSFLKFLIERKIITKKKRVSKNVKILENEFISEDCLSFPRTVYWECTKRCNFKCIHCYSFSGPFQEKKELSLKFVIKLINEMGRKGTEFFSIGGGEPLLYPYLNEVIKHSKEKGLACEISTNGSLINKEKIKRFKEAGLKFIQVSLDGASEKTYSKIRRGGNFKLVIKNISELVKENFVVSISMVVNKINWREVDTLIDLSKSIGARFFRVIPMIEIGRARNLHGLQLQIGEFRKLFKYLAKRKKTEKDIFIQFNLNLLNPFRKNISWMPKNHYGCPAGRSTCGIDSAGNVYPCSFMSSEELNCGNIKTKSLLEIWKNSSVMKKIRNISKLEGKCSECQFLKFCRGGCRASAFIKTGKLNESDPLCSVV